MRILGVLVIIWLVIGAIAAGQRHYFSKDAATSCASASTIVVTIVGRPAELLRGQPEGQLQAPRSRASSRELSAGAHSRELPEAGMTRSPQAGPGRRGRRRRRFTRDR